MVGTHSHIGCARSRWIVAYRELRLGEVEDGLLLHGRSGLVGQVRERLLSFDLGIGANLEMRAGRQREPLTREILQRLDV